MTVSHSQPIVERLRQSAEACSQEDRLDLSEQHEIEMEAADRIEELSGPLAELVIAYQDADSPAIQDTLRRARAALSQSSGVARASGDAEC